MQSSLREETQSSNHHEASKNNRLAVLLGLGVVAQDTLLAYWSDRLSRPTQADEEAAKVFVKRASLHKVIIEFTADDQQVLATCTKMAARWLAQQTQVLRIEEDTLATIQSEGGKQKMASPGAGTVMGERQNKMLVDKMLPQMKDKHALDRISTPSDVHDDYGLRNQNAVAVAQGGVNEPRARLHQAQTSWREKSGCFIIKLSRYLQTDSKYASAALFSNRLAFSVTTKSLLLLIQD